MRKAVISNAGLSVFAILVALCGFLWIPHAGAVDKAPAKQPEDGKYATTLLLGRQYQKLDKVLLARQHAYESDPTEADSWLKAFGFSQQPTPALEPLLTEWIKKSPRSYAARFARAEYYYARAWEARGTDYIDKVPPEKIKEMDQLLKEAVTDLTTSLSLASKPLLSYASLINIGGMQGWDRKNNEWLAAANQMDPTNVLVRRAYLLMLRPQWGGSLELMRAFIDAAKRAPLTGKNKNRLEADLWRAYARQERMNNNYRGAVSYYSKAIALYAEDAVAFNNRGMAYGKLNEMDNAIRDFSQAIKLDPDYADAYIQRAWQYRQLRKYDKALADLNVAVQLAPSDKWAWSNRGTVLYLLGRNPEAIVDYQRAANLGEPWAQYALGEHYWRGKGIAPDRDKAVHWWKTAAGNGSDEAMRALKAHGFLP